MRIAFITSGVLPVPAVLGGAVETLIDYALEYNEKHSLHEIDIYSVYCPKVKKHNALLSTVNHYKYINVNSILFRIGAKIHSLIGRHYCYHYQLEYYFERVWNKMKSQKYDLIILENRPGFALQLKERTNTPIISHIHTNNLNEPTPINIAITKSTRRFIAVSKYIKAEIKKVNPDSDIRVVYNGLDESIFRSKTSSTISRQDLGFKENDFITIFTGRLVPQKGIKELLEAIWLLKNDNSIKLIVIGAINYEDTLNQSNPFIKGIQRMAAKLDDRVVFTGFVSHNNIPQYLSLSDVAIIPSHINEAFGMTCIEACAMGLPVIATNDGGIPETLVGEKHIIIKKEKNIPRQIANAILKIKDNVSSYKGNKLNIRFKKETYSKSFFENISKL